MGMRLSKKNTAIELYFIFVVVFAVIALDIAFAIVYVSQRRIVGLCSTPLLPVSLHCENLTLVTNGDVRCN